MMSIRLMPLVFARPKILCCFGLRMSRSIRSTRLPAMLRMPASSTPADDRGFIPWSEAPVLTRFGAPVYPEFARQAGLEGTVLLEVTVGASGRVESASVIHSDVNPPMEKAAVAAAMRFEFRPATQRGIPVRATVRVPVRFRLR